MKFLAVLVFSFISFTQLACSTEPVNKANPRNPEDPYLWMEEIEGKEPVAWADAENARTLKHFESNPLFKAIEKEVLQILEASDRVPGITPRDGFVYNFWQDDKNPQGLWRRTTLEDYRNEAPKWDNLLDLDLLSKKEGKKLVFKGAFCLHSNPDLCLLQISNGGKDAASIREYDLKTRTFVEKNAFNLPDAKQDVAWLDQDTILFAAAQGPGTVTKSGYAATIKKWKRGTPLESAEEIYRCLENDMLTAVGHSTHPTGETHLIFRQIDFYNIEIFLLEKDQKTLRKVPTPTSVDPQGVSHGRLFLTNRETVQVRGREVKKGSLLALPLNAKDFGAVELVYEPSSDRVAIDKVQHGKAETFFTILDEVKSKALRANFKSGKWKVKALPYPGNGVIEFGTPDPFADVVVTTFTDYLTPATFFLQSAKGGKVSIEKIKQAPTRFDSTPLMSEQFMATSKDGTRVPYFVVRRKDAPMNGSNPTLLYGYGGFEISMTPRYMSVDGKAWLERGGVYVVANIRGGGEFGPSWHQAALGVNRQRAYDDFIAVAEDLQHRKITSSEHLAIQGGSNGGLLVGAVMVQRPDLFRAVISEVPLIDMMRYHLLPPGHSWTGEYGNPDEDPAICEAVLAYSPYQNYKPGVQYPELLLYTSRKDDRVHPGHARKLGAKAKAYDQRYWYYENPEGGHGGAANLKETAIRKALEYTFLFETLK